MKLMEEYHCSLVQVQDLVPFLSEDLSVGVVCDEDEDDNNSMETDETLKFVCLPSGFPGVKNHSIRLKCSYWTMDETAVR